MQPTSSSATEVILKAIANKFRQKAKQDTSRSLSLKEWMKLYLPHHVFRSFSAFHDALFIEYDELRTNRGRKDLIIAPRGNAKTTGTMGACLRAICEQTEQYIFLISDTEKQAMGILETIKNELELNEKLRNDYPLACSKGPVWNNSRIETTNNICVEALGTGQKVRGRKFKQHRPTLIVLDDPDNDEDVASPTTRQTHIEWYDKALSECGDKETNIIVVGTMIHRECIVGHLEKRPDFRVLKFQALVTWPERMDLWDTWEQLYISSPAKFLDGKLVREMKTADHFYDTHFDDMNKGAVVLWEEKEDLYTLMKMRAAKGHPAFMSEKQNDPRDPTKCEFHESWFEDTEYEYSTLQNRLGKEKHVSIIYGDPAKGGETKKHDYSPILTLHRFGEDPFVYVEIYMEKIPVTMFTDRVLDTYVAMRADILSFEENGFQELVGSEIMQKAEARKIFALNLRPLANYGVHKNIRISRLSVWLQRRFFKFRKDCPYTKLLKQQLLDHPHADHDDGSDALECCLRLLNIYCTEADDLEMEEETYIGKIT